jgi:hypothetical protein
MLVVFMCSGSLCRSTTPLCHNLVLVLMRRRTFYPGIKGMVDPLYCKAIPKSMATCCDPPGHLQTLGVVVTSATLSPLLCVPSCCMFMCIQHNEVSMIVGDSFLQSSTLCCQVDLVLLTRCNNHFL